MAIKLVLELDPDQAAALHRLCDKIGHGDAMAYLYPHVSRAVRIDQAYAMVNAAARVRSALEDAGVGSWPWIESGEPAPGQLARNRPPD